jgi:anaerobic ribonucleoside-triphosphate reductase
MSDSPFEPSHVIKRDGRVLAFDAAKISAAIARAGVASTEFDADVAARL